MAERGARPIVRAEFGERHPFLALSFSTLICAFVGTAGVFVAFLADFWLGIAIMALAAAAIALYVRVWVRRQTKQLIDITK
jgi:membrane protein implicated in regulation of membrane protease activity